MATRYNSYDSRSSTSSYLSDPASSSIELKPQNQPTSSSRAIIKSKPSTAATKTNKNSNTNLANMVKKFMEKKSSSSSRAVGLVIPSDVIAEDLKKTARKGGNFGGLQRKLFGGKIENEKKSEVKALPLREVKGGGGNNNVNARTLAMVLRSERELLNANKEQGIEISQLKMLLQEKNNEVEKLKNLCLKQREEIKALKSAKLFPDHATDCHLKQGSELKQVIPSLQRQVTSLTGHLQSLAQDLAEVKAEKYSARTGMIMRHGTCPRTPSYDHEEPANSLEFSSEDVTTPGSPDDLFLKDLNPCLTPFSVKKKTTKEFEASSYDSPELDDESFCMNSVETGSSRIARPIRKSDESKRTYGKQMLHKVL
ncbi:Structural maintenance of chromosomes protein [Citrus sinensis]|nr:Structural maintenance of chromosomes protein [Citrus sinensis]